MVVMAAPVFEAARFVDQNVMAALPFHGAEGERRNRPGWFEKSLPQSQSCLREAWAQATKVLKRPEKSKLGEVL